MKNSPDPPTPAGSKAALAVLVALVVLSPWPFGSVHLRTTQLLALVSLTAALAAFLWDARHGQLELPQRAVLVPLLGLWALAAFQLLPLPDMLLRSIAAGPAAVWHPGVPAVAAVLGPGPHPVSLNPEATRRWLAFATGVMALAVVAAPALRERRALLRAAIAIVAGGVLLAVYALVARLVFGTKIYGLWSVPTVAPFGPFVSKNHFAGYVELAALLAVGLAVGLADEARHGHGWLSWIDSRRARWVVIAWGAAFVLVLAVPVSLSRGGVVSLLAGLLIFVLLRLGAREKARLSARGLLAGLVTLVAALALFTALLPTDARSRVLTLTGITTEQSGAYRLAVWRDSQTLFVSSPWVGSGFGAYTDALPRFKTAAGNFHIEHAENDLLEALAEGGLVGAGLIAALLAFVLVRGTLSVCHQESRLTRGLGIGALAGITAVVVHSAFDFNLHIPSNAFLTAALLAVALASTTGRLPAAPLRLVAAIAGAASLAAALLTPWQTSRVEEGLLTRAAPSSESSLRRDSLAKDVVAQLRRRPTDAAAWVALAWLRAPASRTEAAELGDWAAFLDPTGAGVQAARSRLPGPR